MVKSDREWRRVSKEAGWNRPEGEWNGLTAGRAGRGKEQALLARARTPWPSLQTARFVLSAKDSATSDSFPE